MDNDEANHGFGILYEDASMLVVNKPNCVLTQAPPGIDSLEWRIKLYLQGQSKSVVEPYLGVPHRLDRPVSGTMVFGKTKQAARGLAEVFQKKQVTKRYWALVAGAVLEPSGTWDDWMRKVDGESRSELVAADHPEAKDARLLFKRLGQNEAVTWLEIELLTGRSHQIRLQAGTRGHPIVGDFQYGSQLAYGKAVDDPRLQPIALHSRYLQLTHPVTRQQLTIEARPPTLWTSFLETMQLKAQF